jgi:hypothetical protein
MNHSENINELAIALAKAQAVIKPAILNRENTFRKTKYADLKSCKEACQDALSANNLSVVQYCEKVDGSYMLTTMLMHSSGQWLKGFLPLFPAQQDSQSMGAAVTYAKRYGLSALLQIVADEDDDGESERRKAEEKKAEERRIQNKAKEMSLQSPKSDKISLEQLTELKELERKIPESTLVKLQAKIKQEYGALSLSDLPASAYSRVAKSLNDIIKIAESEQKVNAHA